MESFRDALERLTQEFVSELFEIVRTAALEQVAQRAPRETRTKPTRIVRTSYTQSLDSAPVVVRKFDIPVGQPRARRRRAPGGPRRVRTPMSPPQPKVVKFEVVPHPEQKNRRIVLTRLDSP